MKEMGNLSEVPIEPDEQTKLLDTCVSQAGVIGGGVPGGMFPNALERWLDQHNNILLAGGYDAIWVLVCDPESCDPDQSPLERVEHTWDNYKELKVSPLSSKESKAKGIRLESVDDVPCLKNLLDDTPW